MRPVDYGSEPGREGAAAGGAVAAEVGNAPPDGRILAVAAVWIACVLLPVGMTVANKSSPLLLGVAAALANLAAVRRGRAEALLRRYRDLACGRSGLLVLAGIVLAAASVLWSIDRSMTLRGLREALPEFVFAWSFAAAGVCVFRPGDAIVLRYGLVLAAGAIVFEALCGMPLHHLAGARAEPYDLKWSALTLALLAWPAIGDGLRRGEKAWPLAVVIAVAAAAVAAHSSTALCAIAISAVVFGLAWWAPRTTLIAFAALLFAALIVPPWFGQMAGDVIPPRARTLLDQQHAEHRIEVWTSFGRRIGERLWLGHGFNSSFDIGRPGDPDESAIVDRHPHNAFLQMWIELGLVGIVGAAAAIAHVMGRIRALPRSVRAVRLAQLAAVTVLGLVWQNPWRPWWLAAIGLAMALFMIERDQAAQTAAPHR